MRNESQDFNIRRSHSSAMGLISEPRYISIHPPHGSLVCLRLDGDGFGATGWLVNQHPPEVIHSSASEGLLKGPSELIGGSKVFASVR